MTLLCFDRDAMNITSATLLPLFRLLCLLPWFWSACHAAGMGNEDARHLLERTGFGAPAPWVSTYAKLSRGEAVELLLKELPTVSSNPPPDIAYIPPNLPTDHVDGNSWRKFRHKSEISAWWVGEMLHADTPSRAMVEKMTLFWHNHFASGGQKIRAIALLLRQNQTFRRYGMDSFNTLLHAIAKDPAMLVYLDGVTNVKQSPNENFARELMELYTLGEGRYSESDVREAARAFTGRTVRPETGEFVFRRNNFDEGEKTFLGQRGNFDGDAILDLLLARPETADFLLRKLWREFVSEKIDKKEFSRIAQLWRKSNYDMRTLFRAMLNSPEFWSTANRGTLIKSPVELIVGMLRTLEIKVPDALPVSLSLNQLGQDVFYPPNPRGWPGGDTWINSHTLLARKLAIERFWMFGLRLNAQRLTPDRMSNASEQDAFEERLRQAVDHLYFDIPNWLTLHGDSKEVGRALLRKNPVYAKPKPRNPDAGFLLEVLLDPSYQMK